jgi:hypothetical protein
MMLRRPAVFGDMRHDTVTSEPDGARDTSHVHVPRDGLPSSVWVVYEKHPPERSISSTVDRLVQLGHRGGCMTTTHCEPGDSRPGSSTTDSIAAFHSGSRSTSTIASRPGDLVRRCPSGTPGS